MTTNPPQLVEKQNIRTDDQYDPNDGNLNPICSLWNLSVCCAACVYSLCSHHLFLFHPNDQTSQTAATDETKTFIMSTLTSPA